MEIRPRPSGTAALVLIVCANALVYALMAFQFESMKFSAPQAAQWGALYRPFMEAREGELWRMLAANYIHFDLSHLFFNMVALLSWGSAVSSAFGFVRFGIFYTLCGLGGSIVSYMTHTNTVCAGASGAVSGVLGALVAFSLAGDRSTSGGSLFQAILFNGAYALLYPNIDWQAHAGGFAAGIVLGFVLLLSLPKSAEA